jgi:hypothetical protein
MKKLTKKIIKEINEVSKDKYYKITWLSKRIENEEILAEDIYKFRDYFDIFERNKRKFEYTNIHQYNTKESVRKFIRECITIQERNLVYADVDENKNYCNQNEIDKITRHSGNRYYGIWNGYQVFKIANTSKAAYQDYTNILGRIKGRSAGASNHICTFPNYDRYLYYLNYTDYYKQNNKGIKPMFVLFNLNDDLSPYQMHHASQQFMDRNDVSVLQESYCGNDMFPINNSEVKKDMFLDLIEFIGSFDENYSIESYFQNNGFDGTSWGNTLSVPLDSNCEFIGYLDVPYKAKKGKIAEYKFIKGDRYSECHNVISTINEYAKVLKYQLLNSKTGNTIISEFDIKKQEDILGSRLHHRRWGYSINDTIVKQNEYDKNLRLVNELYLEKDKTYIVKGYDENNIVEFEGVVHNASIYNVGNNINEKRYHYPNGKLKRIEKYTNEKLNGIVSYYDEKGKICKKERYNLGALHWSSDYKHKPLKVQTPIGVETFTQLRNDISSSIVKATAKLNGVDEKTFNKNLDEIKKLQDEISKHTQIINDLKNKIDELNNLNKRTYTENNELDSAIKEVVEDNNKMISEYLAPLIDEFMSTNYTRFQRYKTEKDTDRDYYSSTHNFPYYYTHDLGYILTFKLKRSYFNIYDDDSSTEIIDRVGKKCFFFDIELVNKNYNDIAKRNFGWGDNSKHYGEIALSNNNYSAEQVLEEVKAKIKYYADFVHDRKR